LHIRFDLIRKVCKLMSSKEHRKGHLNDKTYIASLKAGDSRAFELLVDDQKDRIINICYRFVQNSDDAEDLAQEVFIEIFRSVSSFNEKSKLSTWIYRIAVTKSLDAIKAKKRKKRYAPILRLLGAAEENELYTSSTKPDQPDDQMEQSEHHKTLHAAIDKLPENQRIAFRLSKIDGFSNKDVAEVMDTSVSAIEALLNRAKKNLKKLLYNYYKKEM
jgi:RNA polymerase sigma-70 factor (ECF subfamily)